MSITVVLGLALLTGGCAGDADPPAADGSAEVAGESSTPLGPDHPLVRTAVEEYTAYASQQVDDAVRLTTVLTDAVRAGDLAAAQAAYAPSRVPWERIEPLAGLVEEIDGAVDARVDDFESVDDPEFTGWHRLEYLLFAQNTTEGAAPFADRLDADLETLQAEFVTLEVPPVAVPVGAAELIEEVSAGKITGEEDRYSKTDLWDFNANLEGSQAAIERLAPALREADAALLTRIEEGFADLQTSLAPFRDGDGWQLYCLADDDYPSPRCPGTTVPPETVDTLAAQLAALSEEVALTAGALGLS
ncbi:EfeM/EfeO family lipoprotein [Pseudonocardia sp.]|uniref:EfeM/EfeO family lipoprotein n=1 Tax=Pseudonocardia sp. TaxID=60912 RepID=UPI002628192C|nr:EfeM/EfeO family lipoprotein [Pseudonocardia sp.]